MGEDERVERVSLAITLSDPALKTDNGGRPGKAGAAAQRRAKYSVEPPDREEHLHSEDASAPEEKKPTDFTYFRRVRLKMLMGKPPIREYRTIVNRDRELCTKAAPRWSRS